MTITVAPQPIEEATMAKRKRLPEGVRERHRRGCPAFRDTDANCRCEPTYEGYVYDPVTGKKQSKTLRTPTAARRWREDARRQLERGSFRTGQASTVRQSGRDLIEGMRAGLVRNRSGDPYKPSTVRAYDEALELRIIPMIGPVRLNELRRGDLNKLVGRWLKEDLSPSTIRNTLMPLRVIYRRAIALDEVAVNPTTGLELPAVRGARERFASPWEAARLIAAAPAGDRALWATAMYAGLRRGELRALHLVDVDLGAGVIRVRRGWDREEGEIEAKSKAGRRTVPIPTVLRDHLTEHRMSRGPGLFFGRDAETPFAPEVLQRSADRAWGAHNERDREHTDALRDMAARGEGPGLGQRDPSQILYEPLERITLHECRHTFASLMIAAGVNAKALQVYMGHASVTITLDRYGHLMPGNEEEAGKLLDTYLERANDDARKAAVR